MADATIPVPLWLLWGRAVCAALSLFGFAVHYNLRIRDRRRVEHSIKKFYVAVARANRLERLGAAAGALKSGMEAIYGEKRQRIVVISLALSILYLAIAFIVSGGLSIDWKPLRQLKSRIEIAADPVLYSKPQSERARAQEQFCVSTGQGMSCEYKYNDDAAREIRDRIDAFGNKYRDLIAKERSHTELVMLTLWEGTYLGHEWLPVLSLFCFNILLDLTGVVVIMAVAGALSKKSGLSKMFPLVFIVLAASAILSGLSIYSYGLLDKGDPWGIAAVLGLPAGACATAVGIFALVAICVQIVRDEDFKKEVKNELLPALFVALGVLALTGAGLLITTHSWSHLTRPQLPVIKIDQPTTWFFYLIATGVVLPTLTGCVFVSGVVVFGAFARALLFPTLAYVRTVMRMPAPMLVTLTAAPAVVFQTSVSTWPDICRMLRLH